MSPTITQDRSPGYQHEVDFVGHHLFGSAPRLRTLVWLAQQEDPCFYLDQLRAATGTYGSVSTTTLERLRGLGLVVPVPKPGTKIRLWRREDLSPLWDIVHTAMTATNVTVPAVSPQRLARVSASLLAMEVELRGDDTRPLP